MTAAYEGAHIPTPAELEDFWEPTDPARRRTHHRSVCACPHPAELIIDPDAIRDGYVNEDEGIWQ